GPSICSGVSVHTGCASARRPRTAATVPNTRPPRTPTAVRLFMFSLDGAARHRVYRNPGRFVTAPVLPDEQLLQTPSVRKLPQPSIASTLPVSWAPVVASAPVGPQLTDRTR